MPESGFSPTVMVVVVAVGITLVDPVGNDRTGGAVGVGVDVSRKRNAGPAPVVSGVGCSLKEPIVTFRSYTTAFA